jgi:hypothetical protein
VKAAKHIHAEGPLDPFKPGNKHRLQGQNYKAGQAEASGYFVNEEVRTVNA